MTDRPWFDRMRAFIAYMRQQGHRYTWVLRGQTAAPLGPGAWPARHSNDNRRSR